MTAAVAHEPAVGPARARFAECQERLLAHYEVEATSRYVELRSPRMRAHLLEAGRGDPVVVLHGGDGQGVDWAPLVAPLQHHVRLYAVDRPGFGLSDPFDYRRTNLRRHAADFVVSLLDALGLETATIMGGSMGGFFTLATAVEHPERVRALVLVGMPVGVSTVAPLPLRVMCGVPGLTRLFMRSLAKGGAERRRKQYAQMFSVDPATVPDAYFEMQAAGLGIPGATETWAVLLPRVAGLRGMRPEVVLLDELSRLDRPTLFIWGENDMAPAKVGRDAAARMPSARFEYLPGIGHFPFLETPDRCAELILDFLGEGA
jgi:pimeloyl-ACP methyl ester carboxylesterase